MTNDWREGHASALDYEIAELEKLLVELENAEAIAEARGNEKLAGEYRACASITRAEVSAMRTEARGLRAAAADRGDELPMMFSRPA